MSDIMLCPDLRFQLSPLRFDALVYQLSNSGYSGTLDSCFLTTFFFLVQHEAQLVEDGTTLSGFQQTSSRFESSDDDYADSDDTTTEQPYIRPAVFHPRFPANKLSMIPPLRIKRERELKRRPQQNGWAFKRVWCLSISPLLSFSYRSLPKKMVLNMCFMLTPLPQ